MNCGSSMPIAQGFNLGYALGINETLSFFHCLQRLKPLAMVFQASRFMNRDYDLGCDLRLNKHVYSVLK